ncbi:MAG: hypothetical protein MJZ32_09885 [Bacteroidaceae bacterium]|nr:hypothetical protein [Bacteroidaceae bacterium]
MKKQYITPLFETIKSEAQTILAGSPTISDNGYSDTSQDGLVKRNSFLEDDDFDDEDLF